MSNTNDTIIDVEVGEEYAGYRLDVCLAELVEDASRSYLKKLIKEGRVTVNGQDCTRPARAMTPGDQVRAELPPPPDYTPEPQDIPLEILFEDQHLIIVNKPSGLVVHPAPGHYDGTLVNAVLYHCPDFQQSGNDAVRPGVVHRLDQYTSGVMVVAKTESAFTHLARQAHDHLFDRHYLALVRGEFPEERGRVDAAIGRSLQDRKKMAVTGVRGKDAITNFEVLERFGVASLIQLKLETGRTHQIRVHMRFSGRPVLGDPTYGDAEFRHMPAPDEVKATLRRLKGQALHAELLGIEHPATGERMTFTAPPPEDFQQALDALRTLTDTDQT